MAFSVTAEQEQFRAALRRFFDDRSPPAAVREAMSSADGFDRTVWAEACADLGIAGIRISERYGGAGFGYAELGIALEEMGRCLYCGPFFASSVLAAEVVLAAATEPFRELLLPSIAEGRAIATLALAESAGVWDPATVAMTATPSDGGARLSGTKHFVVDGAVADVVLVIARAPGTQGTDGVALYLADADDPGLERRRIEVIDPTRRLAVLSFDDVRAECISTQAAGAPLCRALDHAAIALASEMAGGCQVMLEQAVEYAKLRMQFGRPVGSFQAVKHQCANLLLEVEHAKSAAAVAAAAIDEGASDIPALAALAKATAADAYVRSTATCIQIHGGIGFTWDNDTHLWFKRAKSTEVLLGTPAWHRERYIRAIEAAA